MENILSYLNVKYEFKDDCLYIDSTNLINKKITSEYSTKLRASYYFMGALLGKYKHVEMCFPGGCSIGERPINLHLKGFEKLGSVVVENDNKKCYG